MRSYLALIALVVVAALPGCRRTPELNVMFMPPVCDSVPPPVKPGELVGGVVPTGVVAIPDSAVAVGTVVEATTRRRLAGVSITLRRDTALASMTRPIAAAYTNPSGGFVLTSVPGTYTLTVRLIGRPPARRQVTLHAGVVDTLSLEMRYMSCLGY